MAASGQGLGQGVLGEPPDVAGLERVRAQLPAHGPAVEHEGVERKTPGTEAQAVNDGDQPERFDQSMPVSSATSLTTTSAAE